MVKSFIFIHQTITTTFIYHFSYSVCNTVYVFPYVDVLMSGCEWSFSTFSIEAGQIETEYDDYGRKKKEK